MEKTLRSINGVYYSVYMLTILSAVGVFVTNYLNVKSAVSIDPKSSLGIALSSLLILYILISIPLSFWLFFKGTKKWKELPDKFAKFTAYKKASVIRLWVVGIGLILGVMLVYFLHSTSMIYCALISAVALFFSKPSEAKMVSELNLEEEE